MNKIIQYFAPKGEQSYFETQKTISFIVIEIIGVFLGLGMFTKEIMFPAENIIEGAGPSLVLILFIISTLFMLKSNGIKKTGNIFSIGIVLIIAISANILDAETSTVGKLIDGFYFMAGMFTVSVLFGTRKTILINTAIIIITAIRVATFGMEHFPESYDLFQLALTNYIITIIIIFLVLFFTNQFSEKAIELAMKDAKIKEEQNESLMKMVTGIKQSSYEIFKASDQLSSSSQEISSNANKQAATTEELSSSMQQMLATISSNTEKAVNTERITTKSAKEIKESNEVFLQTIQSVSDISRKTSIITDIAFQTNILSLNASIEAARAGTAGNSFAVVAQEVRNLAEKSKIASEEINEISFDGQNISKVAGKKLEQLIPEIIKSATLVNDIVIASKEQLSGVEMINTSIRQLTSITNENSASAEEMSASAEELSAQAEHLNSLISGFNIGSSSNDLNTIAKEPKKDFPTQETKGFEIDLSQNDKLDDKFEEF